MREGTQLSSVTLTTLEEVKLNTNTRNKRGSEEETDGHNTRRRTLFIEQEAAELPPWRLCYSVETLFNFSVLTFDPFKPLTLCGDFSFDTTQNNKLSQLAQRSRV